MRTLKEFQENMPNGLYSIAVDITGFCNAKCKYCPAGNDLTNKGKFVELETFEAILNKLIEYKLYTKESDFNIYCLGEPLLHPQINDILNILNKYGIRITISTNASYIPKFDKESLKCVKRFLISMPGFSQESYDRIHGFNFNKIKENVISLREKVRELSDNTIPFDMSYHIYQFNEAEMVPAKQFCEENDIRFAPNYAVMFDKDKCMDYVTGNMSYEELKDISKEIFLGVLDQQIKDAPRNYCDFQHRFLSITVDGDIRICS
ncbi:MAG: radical SAM protein, partial [Lachnospiraceae bacterium]|nr:radical SAM protein [Lachnospiraceae bacterium]